MIEKSLINNKKVYHNTNHAHTFETRLEKLSQLYVVILLTGYD